jgi:competence protein ComEA
MLEKKSAFLDKLADLPYWQLALIAALALGVVAGGYFVLRPHPHPEASFHAAEEAPPTEPKRISVYVTGAVNHPGVVVLEEGARVINAIEKAGGPLPEADLEALNLAQAVQDGQKILVRRKGETGGEDGAGGDQKSEKGKVNINQASARELERLPGIGPTLAERIVAYREKKGGFKDLAELKQVAGIGEKKYEEIRGLVEL